ncbi:MAG: UDP-N-acetylglucosamine 1-carboxyvinyltransferase [Ruminococcaceae bacterium]|nr:UDP-N-acetylglucosamine 1-carboxyvinyltransferase [Oscillospiraceae bacterium]
MSEFIVNGGKKLYGDVTVQGAKNSVLPLLAATYLSNSECVLHNCPRLSDVDASVAILEHLGAKCRFEGNTLTVDSNGCFSSDIPETLMREMRSSIIFLGAIIAKCKAASMSLPGGCELGPRPIDIHLSALRQMGAEIECTAGRLICTAPNGLSGAEIHLNFPSVGATENIILTACKAKGTTVIYNAAKEPEICDLASFLNSCGAKIKGAGTPTVVIEGERELSGCVHNVIPDRIVAATYLFTVAMCKGAIRIKNAIPEQIFPFCHILQKCGCDVSVNADSVTLRSHNALHNFDVVSSGPYPGFPTDAGPSLVSASCLFKGTGVFVENIFDSRFRYVDELKRLGADIKVVGRAAIVTGVKNLAGAKVEAHDLRGGAALVSAAVAAHGTSVVRNIEFIDRGYENIEKVFAQLGAEIKRK